MGEALTLKQERLAEALANPQITTFQQAAKAAGMHPVQVSRVYRTAKVQSRIETLKAKRSDKARAVFDKAGELALQRLAEGATDQMVVASWKTSADILKDGVEGEQDPIPHDELQRKRHFFRRALERAFRLGQRSNIDPTTLAFATPAKVESEESSAVPSEIEPASDNSQLCKPSLSPASPPPEAEAPVLEAELVEDALAEAQLDALAVLYEAQGAAVEVPSRPGLPPRASAQNHSTPLENFNQSSPNPLDGCTHIPVKHCRDCRESKPVTDFYANRSAKDGFQTYCKPCQKRRVSKR